ncbi:MAG: hypothetical protein QXW77_02850 [Candidatus Hadarchaeales archaeon]
MQPTPPSRRNWWIAAVVVVFLAGGAYFLLTLREAGFEVSIEAPSSVTVGDTVNVKVTVKNVGDRPGTYELVVKLPDGERRENLSLSGGEERTLTYSFVANSVGIERIRAGDRTFDINVRPRVGAGDVITGTVTSPVNWQILDNLTAENVWA